MNCSSAIGSSTIFPRCTEVAYLQKQHVALISHDVWFEREHIQIIIITIVIRLSINSSCSFIHFYLQMSLIFLWLTLYWVFCQTDCYLGSFNGALPHASGCMQSRFLCYSALCWTVRARNHCLSFSQQWVLCFPHGEYQALYCLCAICAHIAIVVWCIDRVWSGYWFLVAVFLCLRVLDHRHGL